MKTLLIIPPYDQSWMAGEFIFEPLGVLYVAAVLRENNYDVEVIDAEAISLSIKDLEHQIRAIGPNIVGISTLFAAGGSVYNLGQWIKRNFPEVLVVLGNAHAAVFDKQYLKSKCCDVVVHGEGEYSMLEIANIFKSGKRDFSAVTNASFMLEGEFFPHKERGLVKDLSELPYPARDLVSANRYGAPLSSNRFPLSREKNKIKHMFTSRGCPNRCAFCLAHHGQNQRFNSIPKVVDEIELLIEQYGAEYIDFSDPLFTGNKKRAFELCDEIINRGIQISWGVKVHVKFIDADLVKKMEAAGCKEMAFGIESGVERVLRVINKNTKISEIENAIWTVKNNSKILVLGFFMLGLPTESREDFLQTIKLAKRLPLDAAQFNVFTPFPGCEIYNDLVDAGQIDTGIRENDSLDPSVWQRYHIFALDLKKDYIWVTDKISHTELLILQKKAYRAFYYNPKRLLYRLKKINFKDIPRHLANAWQLFF